LDQAHGLACAFQKAQITVAVVSHPIDVWQFQVKRLISPKLSNHFF
jgi:hypothetical protein